MENAQTIPVLQFERGIEVAGEEEDLLRKKLFELKKQNKQLQVQLEKYQRLAKAVQEADFWDFSLYDVVPDENWVAVERDDYKKMMAILAELDETRPWKFTIEKRLRGV